MALEEIIVWLVIGAIAGWLAGLIMKGYGFGLIGNIVVGIIGAVIAGWLLPRIGFVLVGGIVAAIINAVIGAVILLFVIGLFKKVKSRRLTFGASPRRAPRPSNQGCFEAQKWEDLRPAHK